MKNLTKIAIVLTLFFWSGQFAYATPFSYSGPSANNVDTSSPTFIDLMIANLETITNLTLSVNIGFDYADNIDIFLIHDSVEVHVYNGQGDTWSSAINATFDDAGSTDYQSSGSVIGIFKPNPGLLSAFNDLSLNGLWQLKLQDDTRFPSDGTPLKSWSIQGNSVNNVPEPTVIMLIASGLIGFGATRRNKAL